MASTDQTPQLSPPPLLVICTASHFHPPYPHGQTTCRYPNKSRGPEHMTSTPFLATGLVALYIISQRDGSAREGVLRYPKHNGDQSRPHGIKLFLFCAIPSTTYNLMNNQDLKFSATPNDYTSIGTILDPKRTTQDHKLAQTPVDPTTGLLCNQQYGKVIMPK